MKNLFILALLVSFGLVSCQENSRNEREIDNTDSNHSLGTLYNDSNLQTTISFAIFDEDFSLYKDLIKVFEEENPDIHIELVSVNNILESENTDGNSEETASFRIASSADVLGIGPVGGGEGGLILDLTPFIDSDPSFNADDFYPGILDTYQSQGGIWAIPTEVDYQLIFYNKDAFDAAVREYPQNGWTWNDFQNTAKALTTHNNTGEVTQWGFVLPWPNHMLLILSQIGSVFNYNTESPTPRFTDNDVINAVKYYTDLYLIDNAVPIIEQTEIGGLALPKGFEYIDNGLAAMWPDSAMRWYILKEEINLGVVSFPVSNTDSKSSPATTDAISISAGTKNPDAAWQWIHFLTRHPKNGFSFNDSNFSAVPARRSVAEAKDLLNELDDELAKALEQAITHSYTHSHSVDYTDFIDAVIATLNGESPTDALAIAQEKSLARVTPSQKSNNTQISVVSPVSNKEDEDMISIVFAPFWETANLQAYRELTKQFELGNPDIRVEIHMQNLAESPSFVNTATETDCFQWSSNFNDSANLKTVLNLDPFLNLDPSLNKNDFFPVLLNEFTVQGQIMGLPTEVKPFVIEYNKNIFDDMGIDYPSENWNIDDFLSLAIASTTGEGSDKIYGFVGGGLIEEEMILMVELFGDGILDNSISPPTTSFNDPQTIEAVRSFVELSLDLGVRPTYDADLDNSAVLTNQTLQSRETLINDGRASMWLDIGLIEHPNLNELGSIEIGFAPLPLGSNGVRSSFSRSSGYFISASTEEQDACWEWIKYLTEQPSVITGFPSRHSVVTSPTYQQQTNPERIQAYLFSIENANDSSGFGIFRGEQEWMRVSAIWLNQAYGEIVIGQATVDGALALTQDKFENYRNCVISNDAFEVRTMQNNCIIAADSTIIENN